MNLKNYPRKKYAIEQFVQPLCYELNGEKYHFVMDDGRDYDLEFISDEELLWCWTGEEPKKAEYQCLKADDCTYLVDFELAEFENTMHRVNHCFVIDLEQRLVTRAICTEGYNPKLPYLIKSEYTFGAIDMEGCDLPFIRHTFTAEMLGTRVEWHWSTKMVTRHSYFTTGYYRFTHEGSEKLVERDVLNPFSALPNDDDVAQYIKIKKNMYLFCLTEEAMERNLYDQNPPYRSNNMNFIQNYDRMFHVGRTFGSVLKEGQDEVVPCHITFGAFGNPTVIDPVVLEAPNPYGV